MSLIKGKSEKAFKHNIRTEYKEGKPLKQALAIAYAMKKRKKMAGGGDVKKASTPPAPSPPPIDPDKAKSAQSSMRQAFGFAEGGMAMGCPQCGYADGGQIKDNYQSSASGMHQTHPDMKDHEFDTGFMKHEGNIQRPNGPAMSEDHKKLNQQDVDMHAETSMAEEDMVDRIMKKRSMDYAGLDRYSEGGKIANQEHGPNNNDLAGFSPNEFDDLVLRDDLESTYGEDDNSGDALGNAQEDEDRSDIISRIMKSRKKKDRMPNPA